MNLLHVPLDDRPCNFEQVEWLADIARIQITQPPTTVLGSHFRPFGDPERLALFEWLAAQLQNTKIDACVLSLDMLLYGGLVRSRKLEISQEDCAGWLRRLSRLIDAYPSCRFYLSSVLLRLSVTVTGDVGPEVWKAVFEYSVEADTTTDSSRANLLRLKKIIPENILAEYLAVRERNHFVNKAATELSPLVEMCLFGQEDCAERGLHRAEQAALKKQIERLPRLYHERFPIMTGADELASMLVARAAIDHFKIAQSELAIQIKTLGLHSQECLQKISKYEDITVEDNLRRHAHALKIELGSGKTSLAIFGFFDKQRDLCFETESTFPFFDPTSLADFKTGDYFLDLSFSNGASNQVLIQLLEQQKTKKPWQTLGGFSAWNTTGNRMGTLLAEFALHRVARSATRQNPKAQETYLATRLLDDWIYQSIVRPKLWALAQEQNLNPWALGSAHERFSKRCETWMQEAAKEHFLPTNFKTSLPWPRLFEVKVEWVETT